MVKIDPGERTVSLELFVGGELLISNELNADADVEKFKKAVLFMALISNVRAQGQGDSLKKELKKRNRYLGKMMDVFWNALDKFE